MSKYLTSPRASKNMPKGIPYIIGNELAERFSFYGMKCILVVFMTKYLMDSNGNLDTMSDTDDGEPATQEDKETEKTKWIIKITSKSCYSSYTSTKICYCRIII